MPTVVLRYHPARLYRTERTIAKGTHVAFDLKPGVNTMAESRFKAFYDPDGDPPYVHPGVGQLISDGDLEIVRVIEDDASMPEKVNYAAIGKLDAKNMIRGMVDHEQLRDWRANEKRPEVLAELDKQIALITVTGERKEIPTAGTVSLDDVAMAEAAR